MFTQDCPLPPHLESPNLHANNQSSISKQLTYLHVCSMQFTEQTSKSNASLLPSHLNNRLSNVAACSTLSKLLGQVGLSLLLS